jgi:hypothetical protein
MLYSAFLRDILNDAPNFQKTIRIVRVESKDRDSRISGYILGLLPAAYRIYQYKVIL